MTRFLVLIFLILPINAFSSLTLNESFESALKNNEMNNIGKSRLNQTSEQQKQLSGAYYPKVALKGSYLMQENLVDQKTLGINLTETLYRGGRDRQALLASDLSMNISENQWNLDRLDLYQLVVQTYYGLYLNLNDFDNLGLLKKQSFDRVTEIKNRVKIGRSRKGELLQAEAQLASVDAQLLSAEALKNESEDKFFLVTGLGRNQTFKQEISIPEDRRSLADFLEISLKRPDLINKKIKISQTDFELAIAKRAHLPTLDLTSNYYLNKRSGSYNNTDWDAGIVFSFPLFEGGITSSKVREKLQKKEEAIYSLNDYQKSLEIEITSRYQIYHRYIDQIKAYDLALAKAQKNYDESLKDYRLGLISNLDVLTALNVYLDSKRNSEKTKIQSLLNLKLLEASAGVIQ